MKLDSRPGPSAISSRLRLWLRWERRITRTATAMRRNIIQREYNYLEADIIFYYKV